MISLLPNWQVIKTIGGSRAVALAGFFPFVGYLIVANSDFAELIVLITDRVGNEVDFDLVYSRLEDIYLGMLSLAVGVILYKIFCPKSIAVFQDRYDFLEKELSIATPLRVSTIQSEMSNQWCWETTFYDKKLKNEIQKTKDVKLDDTKISDLSHPGHVDGRGIKSLKAYQSDAGIELVQLLSAYYDMQDTSKGPIRLIAILAFGYGYLKMAWPSLLVAQQIIRGL
jgi:hypothetical protein